MVQRFVTPNSGLCAIAVMAKAPRSGMVKTRLSPPLAPEEAMQMSAAFLRDVTENIRLAATQAPIQGFIAFAPEGSEPLFDGMLAHGTRCVLADGAIEAPGRVQGFGLCLLHAAQTLFAQGFGAVCLLNSDSPTLPTEILAEAARALLAPGERVALGAAEDGGYYMLGLSAPHAHLFEDVAWSTGRVAEQSRARAGALGLEIVELPVWFDVDDNSALLRLLHELGPARAHAGAQAPYGAPATSACIDRLGLAARLGRAVADAGA